MKGVLYLVILLLFMNACDFHKDSSFPIEIIDASLNNIKEEVSVFADYSFIRLETLDTCLLENIVKVDIQGDAVYLLFLLWWKNFISLQEKDDTSGNLNKEMVPEN